MSRVVVKYLQLPLAMLKKDKCSSVHHRLMVYLESLESTIRKKLELLSPGPRLEELYCFLRALQTSFLYYGLNRRWYTLLKTSIYCELVSIAARYSLILSWKTTLFSSIKQVISISEHVSWINFTLTWFFNSCGGSRYASFWKFIDVIHEWDKLMSRP